MLYEVITHMAENILRRLVNNSQMAIDDGVYDVNCNLQKSSKDFLNIIKSFGHATLLTEIKFSSPSLGKIRTLGDPVNIANQIVITSYSIHYTKLYDYSSKFLNTMLSGFCFLFSYNIQRWS